MGNVTLKLYNLRLWFERRRGNNCALPSTFSINLNFVLSSDRRDCASCSRVRPASGDEEGTNADSSSKYMISFIVSGFLYRK